MDYNGRIRLPQKETMWLLSACTNFLVTASSMICFTYEAEGDGERPPPPEGADKSVTAGTATLGWQEDPQQRRERRTNVNVYKYI